MIKLKFCEIDFTYWGAQTRFQDGASVNAVPHDSHHYYVIAHRLGYGDDILSYCKEHEFAHSFVSERFTGHCSLVLWCLAHDEQIPKGAALFEEMAAQQFQRWLRANERPILSGADWDALKLEALDLLGA